MDIKHKKQIRKDSKLNVHAKQIFPQAVFPTANVPSCIEHAYHCFYKSCNTCKVTTFFSVTLSGFIALECFYIAKYIHFNA